MNSIYGKIHPRFHYITDKTDENVEYLNMRRIIEKVHVTGMEKWDVLHFAYQITWRHSLETLSKGKSWWEVELKM